jgi:hypothetical protein
MSTFDDLNKLDVSKHAEKKKTNDGELTYLSWVWAWSEIKKRYPEASYNIHRYEDGLPYVCDPMTGYMVSTDVTIEGITHEMWLPVMDGKCKAMRPVPYEYETKFGKKKVGAATMTDINKAIMRCLTKNLAMHGLGLYIYAGEDLPESDEPEPDKTKDEPKQPEPEPDLFKSLCDVTAEWAKILQTDNKSAGVLVSKAMGEGISRDMTSDKMTAAIEYVKKQITDVQPENEW